MLRKWARPAARARSASALLAALLVSSASADEGLHQDGFAASSKAVLANAFSNRYELDMTSSIELIVRNRTGQEQRKRFDAVSKVIGDRVHSVGRLEAPNHLRGMTILTIENLDRGHDAFVYLPSLDRVRRISTAQRGDSFFGTDVTYEDLERRRVEEFRLDPLEVRENAGESAYFIRGHVDDNPTYAQIEFFVSQADGAILETRYYKRGRPEAFRIIVSPRDNMVATGGHVIPTRMLVENHTRGTTTEVLISELVVNPEIDDRVFSLAALERKRKLPKAPATPSN